jgi:parallel beta-helix repeat protein
MVSFAVFLQSYLATAQQTSLSDLTIRGGQAFTDTNTDAVNLGAGGGIYVDTSGQLRLQNVVIEDNVALYGGGLFTSFFSQGSIDLDNVTLRANIAKINAFGFGGNGGGLGALQPNDAVIRNSQVYSNTADLGGGIDLDTSPAGGHWQIENREFYSNTATFGAGIHNVGFLLELRNSRLHDNHATSVGGGIANDYTLVISNTTLSANSAGVQGGGLYNADEVTIVQSTLSGNSAQFGGGTYFASAFPMALTNSTLSGNTASRDGGGIYATGGRIQLLNTTLDGNRVVVPLQVFYPGMGGGIYITATAIVTAQNTLLADNTRRFHIDAPVPDDCYAPLTSLHSLGHNLIYTTTNCLISGTTFGNITNQAPLLGPLQNNGGSTPTQVPLAGSPAIDHGDNAACPPSDQRGFHRPIGPQCDIGAVEYSPYAVDLPLVRK